MSENVNRLTYANWPLDLANDDVSLGLAALSQVVPSGVVATLTVPSTAAFLQTHHFSIMVGLRDPTTTIPSNRENFRVAVFDATTLTVISRSDSSRTHAVGEIVAPDFTADDARNNPGPMTATGSIPYLALSGNPAELLAGADRTFVVYDSGLPIARAIQAADIPDLSASYATPGAVITYVSGAYVPLTRTVNGHALSADVTVSATDLGTGTLPLGRLSALTTTQFASAAVSQWTNDASYTTLAAVAGVGYLTSVVSAPKWTTARNLAGNSVDGSASVAFANKFIVQGTTDTGLSAAQFLGALGTGLVKNTTSTGVLSIAVAADIPDLSATYSPVAGNASLVTVGTIATGVWSGTAIAVAKGGTGSAFFTVAGPTATRTYTFPDAAATMARTDAGNTFTGVSTGTSWNLTTPTITTSFVFANGQGLYDTAADRIGIYRGTNPQSLELYGTRTDGSNYERVAIKYSSSVITLASEALGSGVARNFNITGGNVGIGTPSPGTKMVIVGSHVSGLGLLSLDASAASNDAYLSFNSAASKDAGFYFKNNGTTKWYLYNAGTSSDRFTLESPLAVVLTALQGGNVGIGTVAPSGNLAVTQTVTATGVLKGFVYTGAVNTNQTLSTEIPAATFTTAGRQWATGAITTQREILITAPTYSFVGASTITNAATVAIVAAPIAGTNATLTNTYALWVQAGRGQFDGGVGVGDATDVVLGTATGSKFGTATSQKMAWWNATPVVQQVLATSAAHTVDDVITMLQTLGLCRQS